MRQPLVVLVNTALVLTLACGSSSEPSGNAGLHLTSPAPAPDTIGAPVVDPLQAEMVDRSGHPLAGAEVRWSTNGRVWFAREAGGFDGDAMLDTTDSHGRTRAYVYRGSVAAPATIRVVVTATGEGDSLTALILPGNPASVDALPVDTALRVGAGFRLRTAVLDRDGNPRPESVILATVAGTPGLTVVDHDSLAAQQIARVAVEASFGGFTDTVWVSVVPDGVLAAYQLAPTTGGQDELAVFDTDGRNWRTIWHSPFHYFHEPALAWHPSGDTLVYTDIVNVPDEQIFRVDLQGNVSEVVTPTAQQPRNMAPLYSADGTWLYYTGVNFPFNSGASIYRRSAAGQVEQLTYPNSIYTTDTEASPSPDGSHVAFTTDRPDENPSRLELAILTVANDSIVLLTLPARTPRWAPGGDLIAFLRYGELWLVNPDGSNPHLLTAEASLYQAGLSWSPDGKWLVAATSDGVRIIQASTGLVLPLAFTRYYASPAWRP